MTASSMDMRAVWAQPALAGDLSRWEYLRDKHDRTAAQEREFCLLQWRPDYPPGPGALRQAAAIWDDQLRVNMRCNRELSADRPRDEQQLALRCARLNRPVLILHGAEDPRPVSATDSLLAALPKARRVVIPGAGHLPWVERPSTVANAIRGFVAGADTLSA
jgi:proline iminopeptidase